MTTVERLSYAFGVRDVTFDCATGVVTVAGPNKGDRRCWGSWRDCVRLTAARAPTKTEIREWPRRDWPKVIRAIGAVEFPFTAEEVVRWVRAWGRLVQISRRWRGRSMPCPSPYHVPRFGRFGRRRQRVILAAALAPEPGLLLDSDPNRWTCGTQFVSSRGWEGMLVSQCAI
jgi:hypothetical protein